MQSEIKRDDLARWYIIVKFLTSIHTNGYNNLRMFKTITRGVSEMFIAPGAGHLFLFEFARVKRE